MCTLALNREGLDREEQVIVDYLEDHNDGAWLQPLSAHFSQKTGLRGRSTLNKKLRGLYEKEIVIRQKTYGKETFVTLVRADGTLEVLDSQIRRYTVLLQEFKALYDNPLMKNETRLRFIIKLAYVLFFARLESKVVANRMNPQNRAAESALADKLEELYWELTNFVVTKCNSSVDVSNLFIRQMPPLIGPTLVDMEGFLEGIREASLPPAPDQGSKIAKSKKRRN